jgi:ABC-type Fe3+ transport system substrate-binding protein
MDSTDIALQDTGNHLADREFGEQWMQAIEEARAESEVSIVLGASRSRDHRNVFDAFEKKYGIKVVATTGSGAANVQRVLAERGRGRFTVDVAMTGSPSADRLRRAGALVPMEELFIHPQVVDRSRGWIHPHHVWLSEEPGYIAAYSLRTKANLASIYYNRDKVSEEEIDGLESWQDLLDPRWKERIVCTLDPDAHLSTSHWQIAWSVLGPNWFEHFIREIQPILLPEGSQRQLVDGLARGKYEIAVFTTEGAQRDLDRLAAAGLPISRVERLMREGGALSLTGAIAILDNAPHPAAAKLFVNWYLSRDGQNAMHALIDSDNPTPSLRTDVEQGRVSDYVWEIAGNIDSESVVARDRELEYAALQESADFIKTICSELGCYGY